MRDEPRSGQDEPERGDVLALPSASLESVLDEAVKEILWGVERALCVGDDVAINWSPDGLAEALHRPQTRPIAHDILKLAGIIARRQIEERIASRDYLAEALELDDRFEQSTRAGLDAREAAAAEFAREFEGRAAL